MPGFRDKLSDQELEALAVYLRASHTTLPPWGLICRPGHARAQRSVVVALRFLSMIDRMLLRAPCRSPSP